MIKFLELESKNRIGAKERNEKMVGVYPRDEDVLDSKTLKYNV